MNALKALFSFYKERGAKMTATSKRQMKYLYNISEMAEFTVIRIVD